VVNGVIEQESGGLKGDGDIVVEGVLIFMGEMAVVTIMEEVVEGDVVHVGEYYFICFLFQVKV